VSGKPAGSFSVSGPPLYGKQAAAVSETSLHIKRTPRITAATTFTIFTKKLTVLLLPMQI
jgi:hypothetical protein